MSFTHKFPNLRALTMVVSSGLAVSACGAAPDGMDSARATETTDTIGSKLCDTCDPAEPNPKIPEPPVKFVVHIAGMHVPYSCDSGWEGDVAEFYWDIKVHRAGGWDVPISYRSADDWVPAGSTWPSGHPSWHPIHDTDPPVSPVTVSAGVGQAVTLDASGWDEDDGLELGDDWMGNVVRPVSSTTFGVGQRGEWYQESSGGAERCKFRLSYDITRIQ